MEEAREFAVVMIFPLHAVDCPAIPGLCAGPTSPFGEVNTREFQYSSSPWGEDGPTPTALEQPGEGI